MPRRLSLDGWDRERSQAPPINESDTLSDMAEDGSATSFCDDDYVEVDRVTEQMESCSIDIAWPHKHEPIDGKGSLIRTLCIRQPSHRHPLSPVLRYL